jgi:hypothetical protein
LKMQMKTPGKIITWTTRTSSISSSGAFGSRVQPWRVHS